jgi:hypothetical protein
LSLVTGRPSGGKRLSPRTLCTILVVVAMVVSETVARCSLPQPSGVSHQGMVAILIPFKDLNLLIVVHIILIVSEFLLVYLYVSFFDASYNDGVEVFSKATGYLPTLMLVGLFLSNKQAKVYTRRKLTEWWEERRAVESWQQLRRWLEPSSAVLPLDLSSVGGRQADHSVVYVVPQLGAREELEPRPDILVPGQVAEGHC